MPSNLYTHIHELARHLARVCGDEEQKGIDGPDMMALRTPDAKHSWGHAAYVQSRKGLLHEMTNHEFTRYMEWHAGVVQGATAQIHEILVDEHKRTAVVRMSIFLTVAGEEDSLEQDMIWILRTNEKADLMTETIEYVDAVTAMKLAEAFKRQGKFDFGVQSSARPL